MHMVIKKGNPISIRLPIELETKVRDRARRAGRNIGQQILYYVAKGLHEDNFNLSEYCQSFEEGDLS